MSTEFNDGKGFNEKLTIKYCGFSVSETTGQRTYNITLQGSKELCMQGLEQTYKVGTNHPEWGHIEEAKVVNNNQGPIYNLELKCSSDTNGGIDTSTGSSFGPKSSELTMSMLQLDLETKDNYKRNWNYNLYSTIKKDNLSNYSYQRAVISGVMDPIMPVFYPSATWELDGIDGTDFEYPGDGVTEPTSQAYFHWAKNITECPPLPRYRIWHRIYSMKKPGVEFFQIPTYTLQVMLQEA